MKEKEIIKKKKDQQKCSNVEIPFDPERLDEILQHRPKRFLRDSLKVDCTDYQSYANLSIL